MDYNKLTPETLSELSRIAGAENVLSGQSIGADMCHDERPLYGTAVPEAGSRSPSSSAFAAPPGCR